MKISHIISLIKISIISLIFYNIFSLFILYTDNMTLKKIYWGLTPYDYKKITLSPNYLSKKSLLERNNRNLILNFLNKNSQKQYLDINYWDYKKIIESFDFQNRFEFEKSFYKQFLLSDNNQNIKNNLKKYFANDYLNFSNEIREKIINDFKFMNISN